jgi:5-methylcytosine-specific restriction endonuclease McrA
MIDAASRRFVRERAGERCEYCRLHQDHSELLHHIEHVVARQHGGIDHVDNLALACHRCNLHKGPNLSGVDPLTGLVENLFHPRRDPWHEHFAFREEFIEGLTPAGRATVEVLSLNDARRLELRRELLALGELD